jgi:hypothetical protein
MNTDQMRRILKEVYVGLAWRRKINEAKDGQIVAIYNRLKREGKV